MKLNLIYITILLLSAMSIPFSLYCLFAGEKNGICTAIIAACFVIAIYDRAEIRLFKKILKRFLKRINEHKIIWGLLLLAWIITVAGLIWNPLINIGLILATLILLYIIQKHLKKIKL